MNQKNIGTVILLVLASIVFVSQFGRQLGFIGREEDRSVTMAALGGPRPASSSENSNEIQELARFAVEHHNQKENAAVELVRVAKAEEQVVAGTLHHLTLEVVEGGKKMMYEAKVWVKPWMNFKEVQEFKYVGDAAPSLTPSDLGAKRGEYGFGWRAVAVDDPSVVAAANDALKAVQQKSNSLTPYELHQIVDAKAEVKEEGSKYEMVLKLKRGDKEEKMRVTVHKNDQGALLSTTAAAASSST